MTLNLLSDPWIPVLDADGRRRVIAPWEMADRTLIRPDWPRADLNIACLELLVAFLFLADPPEDSEDWEERSTPDPDRLRTRLEAYAPAFNLTGEGPLFLQDLEPLTVELKPVDMLFIDSASDNAKALNKDLMVRRNRYGKLSPALAAMALYTSQAFAYPDGPTHRASMRGNGPLTTMIDPGTGLWDLVWANVPYGKPGVADELPWMRPTRISDKDHSEQQTLPPTGRNVSTEAFFGMPWRVRLVEEDAQITAFIRAGFGTRYVNWVHPLTPYRRVSADRPWAPVKAKAGRFGYRHWLGVLAEQQRSTQLRAASLTNWRERGRDASVIVSGWVFEKAKPCDFIMSRQPYVELPDAPALMLVGLIEAAAQAAEALHVALEPVLAKRKPKADKPDEGKGKARQGKGKAREGKASEEEREAREVEREAFYIATEKVFRERFDALKAGTPPAEVARSWKKDLRAQALRQFEELALDGLHERETDLIQRIVAARISLIRTFDGHGRYGAAIFEKLQMEKPVKEGGAP